MNRAVPGEPPAQKPSVQERLESSTAGRVVISLFLLITVISLVVWNLPQSELKKQGLKPVRPYVNATGLDQNWGVFAPPPRQLVVLEARIAYEDGVQRTWSLPRGGPVLDAYWDYRWRKYTEWARNDNRRYLWEPTAAWIARHERAQGRRPVTVVLSRRVTQLRPPGAGPSQEGPKTFDYYVYPVASPGPGVP